MCHRANLFGLHSLLLRQECKVCFLLYPVDGAQSNSKSQIHTYFNWNCTKETTSAELTLDPWIVSLGNLIDLGSDFDLHCNQIDFFDSNLETDFYSLQQNRLKSVQIIFKVLKSSKRDKKEIERDQKWLKKSKDINFVE